MHRIFIYFPLFLLISCQNQAAQEAQRPVDSVENQVALSEAQLKNAQIELGFVENRQMERVLQINGYTETPPQNRISVSFPLGGYVRTTRLLPGMTVRKGEVLVTLEDPQYLNLQEDFLSNQSRLNFLRADLERQETLQRGQSGTEKSLQLARAEYEAAQIKHKTLTEKMRLLGINPETFTPERMTQTVQIKAPANGVVATVGIHTGKYVSPTDVLIDMIDVSDLHLMLKILEADAQSLAVGQSVSAWANANPTKKYQGKIILLNRHVNDDRTIEVHVRFDRQDSDLIPGLFMTAEATVIAAGGPAVPNEALVRFENKHYLFAQADGGAFDMIEVKPGFSHEGFTGIEQAMNVDLSKRQIVIKNAYNLLMKAKNVEE